MRVHSIQQHKAIEEISECKSNMVISSTKHALLYNCNRNVGVFLHSNCSAKKITSKNLYFCVYVKYRKKPAKKNNAFNDDANSCWRLCCIHVIFEECTEESENRKFVCTNNWCYCMFCRLCVDFAFPFDSFACAVFLIVSARAKCYKRGEKLTSTPTFFSFFFFAM